MIDIPAYALVQCSDGPAGRSTYVIVNPITKQITHLVVKSILPPDHDYMVPVDQVEETDPHLITLKCSRDDLKKMAPFTTDEYIHTKLPDYESWQGGVLFWPYVPSVEDYEHEVDTYVKTKQEHTPQGELAVHRGAEVQATDGYVGKVDELLINPTNMQVTHLILHERHVLKQKEVTIPVSEIEHVNEDTVYLKLDKKSVEELPIVPVQR